MEEPILPFSKHVKVIAIHRGRNKKSSELVKSVAHADYNFDFRGLTRFKKLSPIALLIKAYITAQEIPKADVYFIEGGLCLWVGYFLKKRFKKAKIALMVPDPIFYQDESKGFLQRYLFRRKMGAIDKSIDLFFPISPMIQREIENRFPGRENILLPHYLSDLSTNAPKEESVMNFLFVADRPQETGHVKGLDLAMEIFRKFHASHKNAKLYLAGAGTESLKLEHPNIIALGFQSLESLYRDTFLLLAPARYDAYALVVPESALKGVIPLVSHYVGAADDLATADARLVVRSLDTDHWVERIHQLLTIPFEERKALHQKFQNIFAKLEKETIIQDLKTYFRRVIS